MPPFVTIQGVGLPIGGDIGQMIRKSAAGNFFTEWFDLISLDPHGTISTGSEEISFDFTNHSLTTAGDHTWTLADDSELRPGTSIELVVTSTTTITTPADAAFFTSQTLSALDPGTYKVIIFRLTEDATKNYGIAVGVKQ